MPSRDPATGERLSGAAQRKRAAWGGKARKAKPSTALVRVQGGGDAAQGEVLGAGGNPFAGWHPPPISTGPAAIESWCARLASAAASADVEEAPRVGWVLRQIRALGKMAPGARKSWKAAQLMNEYMGDSIDPAADVIPSEDLALCAWAFARAAVAVHEGATADDFEGAAGTLTLRIESYLTQSYLPQSESMLLLVEEVQRIAAEARAAAALEPEPDPGVPGA